MTPRARGLRLPFSRRRARHEIDIELQFHIAERVEELMRDGMSREQAEAEVERRFGDPARIGAEVVRVDVEAQRQRSLADRIHMIAGDVRLAFRGMRRRPGFSAVVVLTLALAIGANTAIFSVLDAVLLHPIDVPGLDRLVAIRDDLPAVGLRRIEISSSEAEDLGAETELFESAAGWVPAGLNLEGDHEPFRVAAIGTIGRFFDVFAARPLLGRVYTPESSEEGRPRVAVLSYAFWQQQFGGDPGVIGRVIQLSGRGYQVVAVMPASFRVPATAQVWAPFIMDARQRSPERRMSLIATAVARMRPGLTIDALRARLPQVREHWRARFPDDYSPTSNVQLVVLPLTEFLAGSLRPVLMVLMGAVSLVLLIACANVGSLQLVRATERERELAVRAALGAGRRSLARQLLVENAVLGACGGLAGVGLAMLLLRVVRITGGPALASLGQVHLSGAVLAFSAGVTGLAVLAFGGTPALRASRVDLLRALNDASRGSTVGPARHRMLGASVVVQVALALVLLLASVLSIRSLTRLLHVDPGFRAEQVLTMRIALPEARYRTSAQRTAFLDDLVQRASGIPGVQGAGLAYALPFSGDHDSSPFRLARKRLPDEPEWHASLQIVSGDYLRAMGVPLLRGRSFTPADGDRGSRVVIIDQTLARQFFPGEDPVGKQITHATGAPAVIVGVAGDVTQTELGAPPKAMVYHPQREFSWVPNFTLAVRSQLDPDVLTPVLRDVVRAIDPELPLFDVLPMTERVTRSVTPRRLAVLTLGWFAALSVLLATLGVSGVIGYRMSQRTQEVGIRVALGALPEQVTLLVVRQGVALAAIGIGLGTVLFLALAPQLTGLLYQVGARDPVTIGAGALVLGVVAAVAAWIPARRAAKVDPVSALRGL